MIYAYIGLSILFAAIGFVVTEKNAKDLLAGYNTMSEAERATFDLPAYLALFRRFHLFLGASFLVLGLLIAYFISERASRFFLVGYPILAYILFVWYAEVIFRKNRGSSATHHSDS